MIEFSRLDLEFAQFSSAESVRHSTRSTLEVEMKAAVGFAASCVVAVLFVVCLCFSDASAQQTAQKESSVVASPSLPTKATAQNEAATNLDAGAQIEKFGKLVAGEWILEGSAKPSPSFPKGRFEKGKTVIQFGPGRLSLIENMHTRSSSGATDDALGIFWWDKEAQGYRSVFCDTNDPNGCSVYDGIGRWEGDAVVFHIEFEIGGKKQTTIETIRRTGPNSFEAVMTHPGTDGTETQPFTWKHTRAGK